jgi:hypothetical protein
MMEAVHRYEGTVNQVMGDGIMALFGAPLSHEDHAVRACYAALRMQEYATGCKPRNPDATAIARVSLRCPSSACVGTEMEPGGGAVAPYPSPSQSLEVPGPERVILLCGFDFKDRCAYLPIAAEAWQERYERTAVGMTCKEAINVLAEYIEASLTPELADRAAPPRLRAVPRLSQHLPEDARADRGGWPGAHAGGDAEAVAPLPARSAASRGLAGAAKSCILDLTPHYLTQSAPCDSLPHTLGHGTVAAPRLVAESRERHG